MDLQGYQGVQPAIRMFLVFKSSSLLTHHANIKAKVKRSYLTNSRSLDKSGWVDWVSGRINEAVAPLDNGLWLSVQIQAFGGKYSQFAVNADNGTSYSVSRTLPPCSQPL